MKLLLVAAALAAIIRPAPAAQTQRPVTGTWTGTVTLKHDGKIHEEYLHVVLKQDGETLTGTAGPDADNQYRISKGRALPTAGATTVTFEFIANGAHSALTLKTSDDAGSPTLKGEARIEGEDGQTRTATVEMIRKTGG